MKDGIKFCVTMIITAVITLSLLVISSKIFVPKWVDHNMNMMTFIVKGFYKEKKNSLDVVFMGNSDTYRGVDPMAMYHEYGFTSYNYVAAGERMWIAYAIFKDTLRYQQPKVIMFNADGLFSTNQASIGNNSKVYDNMPFSIQKIINVFDSNYEATKKQRAYHLLPIFSYHTRYNELTNDDIKYAFYDYHYPLKGMDMVAYRVPYTGDKNYMKDNGDKDEFPDINREYVDKMIAECQEKGIEFVLFHVPSPDSAKYSRYMAIKEYADSKQIKYLELNFNIKEIGINWKEDTSDGGDHLNMFGATKTSIYIGQWLVDNYQLPDHRKDSSYSKWNDDYNKYLKIRKQEIKDAKELNLY